MPDAPPYVSPKSVILLEPDPNTLVPPVRIVPRLKDNPGCETGPKPDPRTRPYPYFPPPNNRPGYPDFGKQKKTRSPWVAGLFAVWSVATEVPDWVDAFWDAFPQWWRDKMQAGWHRPFSIDEKVWLMLNNLELIDSAVALQNVLWNLGEDAIAGKLIGVLDSVGIGVGFNGTPFLKNKHIGMWN